MPESLRDVIEDIQKKLKANAYQNEEHVRLSLVARVVQALGWDIWNPCEVDAEFTIHTIDLEKKRADLALMNGNSRLVFIEIKAVGELLRIEEKHIAQLRKYNEDFRAPFAILTDGRQWWFYYIYSNRAFNESKFKIMNLSAGDLDDLESDFYKYLSKENHLNGHAKVDAEEELSMSERERQIRECLSEAKARASSNPLLNQVQALIAVVKERFRFEINQGEALRCIQDSPQLLPSQQPPRLSDTKPTQLPTDGIVIFPRIEAANKRTRIKRLNKGLPITRGPRTPIDGFILLGQYYRTTTWSALLITIAEIMYKRHQDHFHRVLELQGTQGRYFFSRQKETLQRSKQISNSGIFCDTCLEASRTLKMSHTVLQLFGYSPSDLRIQP